MRFRVVLTLCLGCVCGIEGGMYHRFPCGLGALLGLVWLAVITNSASAGLDIDERTFRVHGLLVLVVISSVVDGK